MLLNCPSIEQWHAAVPRSARAPALVGLFTLLIWLCGFGVWAAFAPLDGAVVAPGTFVATGQNKLVQHLEGGIVRDILVKEGELVEARQILMRIDETATKAKLRRLTLRYFRLLAMQARLQAEAWGREEMDLVEQLKPANDEPEIREIVERQASELIARRSRARAEIEVLHKEIAAIEEGIEGYQSQASSTRDQLDLLKEELRDKTELLDKALMRKSDVLSARRAEARLTGEFGQLTSRIGDANERIARARQQITHLQSTSVQKAIEELRVTEGELDDTKEQLMAARHVLDRTNVQAPVRGIVVKLNFHTSGGVVSPGATIIELVPVNDELVLEARVLASDILIVREGQDALVRLNALNQRLTPMIAGKVTYVSADAVQEQDPRKVAALPSAMHGSFVVRVKLDEHDVQSKAREFRPTPGLPADVFIKTGERTFLEYLLKPILDSFSRAFREQ